MTRTHRASSNPPTLKTEAYVAWAEARGMSAASATRFALLPQSNYLYVYKGRQLPPASALVIAAKTAGTHPPLAWGVPDHEHRVVADLIGEDAANDPAVQTFLLHWAKKQLTK